MSEVKKLARVESMADLVEKYGLDVKTFKYGELVEGKVISVSKDEILVDVGGKSEGIILLNQDDSEKGLARELSVGDPILASVTQVENDQGYLVLSVKRAEKERVWRDLYEMYSQGTPLEVRVLEYNKGGLLVELAGTEVRGFVPLSHLDRVHFAEIDTSKAKGSEADLKEKLSPLVGVPLKVKIIEIDKSQNRLVLSEKEVSYEENQKRREEILQTLEVGQVVEGIVTGVMPFGLFVDIGGVEGLVHISELSWSKVSYPGKLYDVGDTLKAQVIEVDPKAGRVSLSLKSLLEDPWTEVEGKYPVGKIVKGRVSKIMPFGAFVQLEPGLDGLIHVSETVGPLKEGEAVEAKVVSLDSHRRKLGLSVKEIVAGEKSSS